MAAQGSVLTHPEPRHRLFPMPTLPAASRTAVHEELPAAAVTALLAALTLSIGSSTKVDLLFLVGLPLTLVGFAYATQSVWTIGRHASRPWIVQASTWLSAMAAWGLVTSSMHAAPWHEVARRVYALSGVLAVGTVVDGNDRLRRRVVHLMVAGAVILHLLTPLALPRPPIDVLSVTQSSVEALLRGVHPYTIQPHDVTNGAFDYGYKLTVYPYMPLTLLMYAPAVAFLGDFRYVLAASFAVTIVLFGWIGRRVGADAKLVDAAMLALALHPMSLWFTANGWTEGLIVCLLTTFVYLAVCAPDGISQAIVFFLLPSLKQYIVAPALLYVGMKPPRVRLRMAVIAVGVMLASVGPFLVWGWRPTIAGMVFQMRHLERPRVDSDSLVALAALLTGRYPTVWLSAVVQIIVGAIVYPRVRQSGLAGFLAGSALTLYATFLVGWQAFVNYYYLISVALLLAAIVASRPTGRPA
jgi:hypothetical protein